MRAGQKTLSTTDVASLIVGIIVGVGIFQTMPEVARGAGNWWMASLLWLAGGLLSLCGAFGYAELASSDPRPGGDYVYLNTAFGPRAGFLFGWLQTTVVRPGDIAVMAFAFATYGRAALGLEGLDVRLLATGAVVLTTLVNICGVREGARFQNLLTAIKVLGLLVLVVLALTAWGSGPHRLPAEEGPPGLPLQVALILVLFTYGGWNEAVYVAAEMRTPRRSIAPALLMGTGAVALLYLLLSSSFLGALGFEGVAGSEAVAVDAVATAGHPGASRAVGALVALSALGAVNGLVLAGARITDAVARDHAVFRLLARQTEEGPPLRALFWQAVLAVILIMVLGSFLDTVIYTAAAVYSFYLATSVAVLVMRRRRPVPRGAFRVPWFPWPTLVFAGVCLFLIHGAVVYRPWLAVASLVLVLAGLPVHELSRTIARTSTSGLTGKGRLPGLPEIPKIESDRQS
nr:amino acid permease [Candidatus Krumholzibacteria bacterium]